MENRDCKVKIGNLEVWKLLTENLKRENLKLYTKNESKKIKK